MVALRKTADDVDGKSVTGLEETSFLSSDLPRTDTSLSMAGAASRIAGRLAAASTAGEEVNRLFEERRKLLAKKLRGEITSQEERRLTYVRWQIERIEDAQLGPHLDRLEVAIERYEQFATDLNDLYEALARRGARGRKTR